MCTGGGQKYQPPPPPPPPPPPTLDQAAPEVSAALKPSDEQARQAAGSKQYRTSLAISTPGAQTGAAANNTGLGISM